MKRRDLLRALLLSPAAALLRDVEFLKAKERSATHQLFKQSDQTSIWLIEWGEPLHYEEIRTYIMPDRPVRVNWLKESLK